MGKCPRVTNAETEKWLQFHRFMTLLRRSLLRITLDAGTVGWLHEKEEELLVKVDILHANPHLYAVYHILLTGSTDSRLSPLMDFPTECSVVRLYYSLLCELGKRDAAEELLPAMNGQEFESDAIQRLQKKLGIETPRT